MLAVPQDSHMFVRLFPQKTIEHNQTPKGDFLEEKAI
jgi:hypothetical protein